MGDNKELIGFLNDCINSGDECLCTDKTLLMEIKSIVEDYPRIKEMLNDFIREEVNEYKNMR